MWQFTDERLSLVSLASQPGRHADWVHFTDIKSPNKDWRKYFSAISDTLSAACPLVAMSAEKEKKNTLTLSWKMCSGIRYSQSHLLRKTSRDTGILCLFFFPKSESFLGWSDGLPVSPLFLPRGATFPPMHPPSSSCESQYYELNDGRNQIFHHSTVILTLVLFIIIPASILATRGSILPKLVTAEVPTVNLEIKTQRMCLCSDIFPAVPVENFLGTLGPSELQASWAVSAAQQAPCRLWSHQTLKCLKE